jgi:subtilisin family serine protease
LSLPPPIRVLFPVIAARSLSQSTVQKFGTSMAAPHVSGLIALLMQAAPQPLTADQIRKAVLNVARRDPPLGADWQPRYGAGRINALASVRSVLGLAPVDAEVEVITAPELAVANGNGNGNGNGYGHAGSFFEEAIAKLIENSAQSKIRLRMEIEVEPMTPGV